MPATLASEFGVGYPIFAFSHCRDVVAEVSRRGGFGVYGAASHTVDELDTELHLIDSTDYRRAYEARLDIEALASTDDLRLIIGLHLDGWSWQQIAEQLHQNANTVAQRFRRWKRGLQRTSSNDHVSR